MYCEKCGKKSASGAAFCRGCGAPLKSSAELFASAEECFRKGDYDRAIETAGLAGKEKRFQEKSAKLAGDIYFLRGNFEQALDAYGRIDENKRTWDVYFNTALIMMNTERVKEAVSNLENTIKSNPDPASSILYSEKYQRKKQLISDIYLYLGALNKAEGNDKEAMKAFIMAEKNAPENEFAPANLGDLFLKEDNYDEAIKYYLKAAALSQDGLKKSHLYNDLGLCYFRKGLVDDALAAFKKAVILNPENNNAVFNLGTIYVKSGMHDNIKNDYKEFLKHAGGVDILFNISKSIMDAVKSEQDIDASVNFIGADRSILEVKKVILKAAAVDSTVFISGENGTGKELAARAIHQLSPRADRPFIVVNCGALPETLLESELFGYEKGAFTGAVKDKQGRFEIADTGTVFIDEIGDITPAMQVKLLRFVQEREFERVGGTKTIKVNLRIICASNRDIKNMVAKGQFREDLYYRLYVLPVIIPPLRERKSDILPLAVHFLRKFSEKAGKKFNRFSDDAVLLLTAYEWPGNVRQLENVMERIATLFEGEEVIPQHLPAEILQAKAGSSSENSEKDRVLQALKDSNYSKTKAAGLLGISRVALWKKMKKLDVKLPG